MESTQYALVTAVGSFDEGETLVVTTRLGDDHLYDVRLEPTAPDETGSLELTAAQLDVVARPVDRPTSHTRTA